MKHPLQKEFDYYREHQAEIVKKHNEQFVVIKDCSVVGAYKNAGEAVKEAQKKYKLGTFLIQYVSPGDADYTQHFHSRVAFS